MADSFGPRTYLVGQILPILLPDRKDSTDETTLAVIDAAIRLADMVMERMQWPNGKP